MQISGTALSHPGCVALQPSSLQGSVSLPRCRAAAACEFCRMAYCHTGMHACVVVLGGGVRGGGRCYEYTVIFSHRRCAHSQVCDLTRALRTENPVSRQEGRALPVIPGLIPRRRACKSHSEVLCSTCTEAHALPYTRWEQVTDGKVGGLKGWKSTYDVIWAFRFS